MQRGRLFYCLGPPTWAVPVPSPRRDLRMLATVDRLSHRGTPRLTSIKFLVSVILLFLTSAGCRHANVLFQTTVVEPLGYARFLEERRELIRFRQLAKCALVQEKARLRAELDNYACEPFSADEECGFLDGFVDYLDAGGTGNPPPLPPRRYWRTEHENPNGYRAVQDWYRGYAHGAAAAQASGYRELVTICTSDSLGAFREPYYPGQDRCLVGPPIETTPVDQPRTDEPSRLVMESPQEPLQLRIAERDTASHPAPQVIIEAPLTPPLRSQPPDSRAAQPQSQQPIDVRPISQPPVTAVPPPPLDLLPPASPKASVNSASADPVGPPQPELRPALPLTQDLHANQASESPLVTATVGPPPYRAPTTHVVAASTRVTNQPHKQPGSSACRRLPTVRGHTQQSRAEPPTSVVRLPAVSTNNDSRRN